MAVKGIDNVVFLVDLFVLGIQGAVFLGNLTVERFDGVVLFGNLSVEGVDNAVFLAHLGVERVNNAILFVNLSVQSFDGAVLFVKRVILCRCLVRSCIECRFAVGNLCIGGFQQILLVFGLCRYAFELLFEFSVFFA